MRSLSSRFALVLGLGASLLAVGCSSGSGSRSAPPTAAKHSITEGQAYVASPTKHWQGVSETRKREAEAAKAEARLRGGTPSTHVARPAVPSRSFPEPIARTEPLRRAEPAPCAPAPVAAAAAPPCEELCPGGKCGIPAPAFCCDPCCPGGKCEIPAPALPCFGK